MKSSGAFTRVCRMGFRHAAIMATRSAQTLSIAAILCLLIVFHVFSAIAADPPRLFPSLFPRYPVGDALAYNPLESTEGPKSLNAADMNGDGLADVIAANLDGSISILLGTTNRTLMPQILYSPTNFARLASLRAVVAADFNQDGRVDIAVTDIYNYQVVILFGNGDGTLRFGRVISVGRGRAMAAGDFNRDGHVDLLVACGPGDCETCSYCTPSVDRFVCILKGNGDGSFQPAEYLVFPPRTECYYDVVAADINNDGWPDAVILSFSREYLPQYVTHKNISIYLNQGNGHFNTNSPSVSITPAREGPRALTLAYIDEVITGSNPPPGALLDLVVVNRDSASIDIWLNQDGTNFIVQQPVFVGDSPRDVAVADTTHDGLADLVVVNRNLNCITLFRGTGHGQFVSMQENYPTGVSPRQIVLADFNGDGNLDAAVNNRVSGDISLFNGLSGASGWGMPDGYYPAGFTPISVASADFNGDGLPDAATANLRSHDVRVRLNLGDGTLGPETVYPVNRGPIFLAAGDVNGDGHPDLVVSCLGIDTSATTSRGSIVVLLGSANGQFTKASSFALGNAINSPYWLRLADLSGDGKLDIAVTGINGSLVVFKGNGNGTFNPGNPIGLKPSGRPLGFAIGDFDRDGRQDIVCSSGQIFYNDGQFFEPTNSMATNTVWHGRWQTYRVGPNAWATETADLDGDGYLDLMVAQTWAQPDPIGVYWGTSDGRFMGPDIYAGPDVGVVGLYGVDMDGDGTKDIVVGNRCAATVIIMRGLGNRQFEYSEIVATPSVESIAIADMNKDNRPDVVGAGIGLWVILNQNGTNRIIAPRTAQPGETPIRAGLYINEVMTLNQQYFVYNGLTPDWVELYNHSATPQNLSGWALARVPVDDNPSFWFFPQNTVIGAYSNLTVFCRKKSASLPGLRANFDLSADGETLVLFGPGLMEVDRVDYPAMPIDTSWARFNDGARFFCYNPAPTMGAKNMRPGNLQPTIERKQPFVGPDCSSIGITGRAFDDVAVAYAALHYRIAGSSRFEEIPLNDDGISGDKAADDGYFGTVLPTFAPGTVIEYYLRVVDIEGQQTTTPGDISSTNGLYRLTIPSSGSPIRISELVADNQTGIFDEAGYLEDWIELVNTSGTNVCLMGLGLTKDLFDPAVAWPLPGLCLDPGQRVVVFCDEKISQGPLHASFKLTRAGDRVYLVQMTNLAVLDSLSFEWLPSDTAWGIIGTNITPQLLPWPTPGSANSGISFPAPATNGAPTMISRLTPGNEIYAGTFNLRWQGDSNATYRVQYSSSLTNWLDSGSNPTHLGQGVFQWNDFTYPSEACFYRAIKN